MKFPILFLAILLGACSHLQLQMPDKYLGYWRAHNLQVDLGIDISPNVILHKDHGTDFVRYIEKYKVFHIDDKYVYLIIDHRITKEWAEHNFNGSKELLDRIMQSFFSYRRYYLKLYLESPPVYMIVREKQDCNLSAKDWDLPAATHWQRIESKYCESTPYGSHGDGFTGHATWITGEDRRQY